MSFALNQLMLLMKHFTKHMREGYLVTFHKIKRHKLTRTRYILDNLSILKSTIDQISNFSFSQVMRQFLVPISGYSLECSDCPKFSEFQLICLLILWNNSHKPCLIRFMTIFYRKDLVWRCLPQGAWNQFLSQTIFVWWVIWPN